MTLVAALLGFAAALVLILGWGVVVLRRDVRALSAELTELKQQPPVIEIVEVPQPAPVVVPAPVAPAPEPQTIFQTQDEDSATVPDLRRPEPEPEDIPVITRISDAAEDDVDLTTRRVASVALARPLIKVASLSYGVRRALDDEHRFQVRWTMRRELKRQRKMRRRRNRGQAPSKRWTS